MMGEIFTEAVGVISWLGPARDDSDLAMYLMRFNETPDSDSRELKALLSLCNRTYWRRVWIIQELYLAKSYVVWCGHKSISDSKWERSLASLNSADYTYSHDFWRSPANQHSMARLFRSTEINTLHRWLSVCKLGDFQCTKEQDVIYALLDISTDYKRAKHTFKIDYLKTPREVFLELLCQRSLLSAWRPGQEDRWLELAPRMRLDINEDLRRAISEEVGI